MRSGGVSIFVHSTLNSSFIPILSVVNETIESCSVEIIVNSKPCILIGIYRPHSDSITNFISAFENLLFSSNLISDTICIIAGDFNINSLYNDSCIENFTNFMHSCYFFNCINEPTRYPNHSNPSLIDHIWIYNMFNIHLR